MNKVAKSIAAVLAAATTISAIGVCAYAEPYDNTTISSSIASSAEKILNEADNIIVVSNSNGIQQIIPIEYPADEITVTVENGNIAILDLDGEVIDSISMDAKLSDDLNPVTVNAYKKYTVNTSSVPFWKDIGKNDMWFTLEKGVSFWTESAWQVGLLYGFVYSGSETVSGYVHSSYLS